MKPLTLLVAALAALALLAPVEAQDLKKALKVRPRSLQLHPRRLAFNNKDGRHQVRLQGRKDRHKTRREARKVTHKLTTPHKP